MSDVRVGVFTTEEVKKAKELITVQRNIQWALGDLTLGFAPMELGASPDVLADFAEEIDYPLDNLIVFRNVAAAWPLDKRRDDVSYTVHRDIQRREDRFTLIWQEKWTATTLRIFLGQGAAQSRLSRKDLHDTLTEAEKQAVAAKYIAENTEKFIASNPEAARRLVASAGTMGEEARDEDRKKGGFSTTEVGDDLPTFMHGFNRGLRLRLQGLASRDNVADYVKGGAIVQAQNIEATLGWLRTWAEGGNLMADLESFLNEQEV